jgi:flagellar biosynthesis chaperone FliJ
MNVSVEYINEQIAQLQSGVEQGQATVAQLLAKVEEVRAGIAANRGAIMAYQQLLAASDEEADKTEA